MGAKRNDITKELLEREYLDNFKPIRQIANELKCSPCTISEYIKLFNIKTRPSGHKPHNISIGLFGNIYVIEKLNSEKNNRNSLWNCKCICGKILQYTGNAIIKQQTCWDCRNDIISKKRWCGYGEISRAFWSKTIKSAVIRDYNFDITIEQGWELFLKQDRKCALTGIDLIFTRRKDDRSKATASLDRIDSKRGYDLDNVQWVHKVVNNLKMDLPEEDFFKWCVLVAKYRGNL